MSAAHEVPDAVLAQAADWFARLSAGDASTADRQAWQAWRDSAEVHRRAWAMVETISQRFEPLQQVPDARLAATAYRSALPSPNRRRAVMLGLAALAGTGMAGWVAREHEMLPSLLSASLASHRTATGEIRNVQLADGTQVWLGTASAFDADYRPDLRRLRLWRGEMLVDTAQDPARPFVVDTPHGRLRALGTRFVTRLEQDTRIAVYEGAVEVTAPGGPAVVIPAGQQASLSSRGVSALTAADPADAHAVQGRYVARNVPLSTVLNELGRYRHGYLSVAPQIADLPVFGSFPMTEPDRVLAMLESVMPIQVRRPLPGWIRVMAR